MGILSRILASPVLGPINGVLWLARTIEEQANAERWDGDKIAGALTELEIDLDLGIEEYEAREAALLQQLKEIREAKND